ncbi:MAG: NADPH-dependent FMN reductase [Ginsengibacter sp.]
MKNILIINGSAGKDSSNGRLIKRIVELTRDCYNVTVFDALKTLPHFDPELSIHDAPEEIKAFRQEVEMADGILICTPEYVFSIPSGLKNAIEWCVSTTVFSDKPVALITASANGEKGHEELQLLMKTLGTRFTPETTLLIRGIKGKINKEGIITDNETREALRYFIDAFKKITDSI